MLRKHLLAVVACAVVALAAMAPSAWAQSAGGCELQGTASFSPGLNSEAKEFGYSFNGDLSSCQSSEAGAPAGGTVSAGEVVTIGGQQFQEPVAAGNGSCESSTTGGTAIVTWSDGTQTVVELLDDRRGGGGEPAGRGGRRSVTLQAVNPAAGATDLDKRHEDPLRECGGRSGVDLPAARARRRATHRPE